VVGDRRVDRGEDQTAGIRGQMKKPAFDIGWLLDANMLRYMY
jgi:hypothetical protein